MAATGPAAMRHDDFSIRLLASYILDWFLLVALAVCSWILGRIKPNFRNFSLADPNIAFPFTERETVPGWLLFVLSGLVPVFVVLVVTLLLVPGATVPRGTPALLVWKRRLWELQVSWLGLLMAVASAWFFVSGLKNMCGKPRPDALDRCRPNMQNADQYIVGGYRISGANGQLYSAAICTQTDPQKLWDGFRSYPSGHSAAAAAGLIYLSLFVASKFAVTFPFVVPGTDKDNAGAHVAFPSRHHRHGDAAAGYGEGELDGVVSDDGEIPARDVNSRNSSNWPLNMNQKPGGIKAGSQPQQQQQQQPDQLEQDSYQQQQQQQQGLRTRAAAPPVFLLIITLTPFCLAIFIAASRWFDYRHHGFDILFGFLIGTFCAIYSFRYYHMPIQDGAGWAWGPRHPDRAFWVGVGNLGYGTAVRGRGRPDYRAKVPVETPTPTPYVNVDDNDQNLQYSSSNNNMQHSSSNNNMQHSFSNSNHNLQYANNNNNSSHIPHSSSTNSFLSQPVHSRGPNRRLNGGAYDGSIPANMHYESSLGSVELQRLTQGQMGA